MTVSSGDIGVRAGITCGFPFTGMETRLALSAVSDNIKWVKLANKDLHTYADRSIDNVLYSNGFEISDVRTKDATTDMISDHNMLLCTVSVL